MLLVSSALGGGSSVRSTRNAIPLADRANQATTGSSYPAPALSKPASQVKATTSRFLAAYGTGDAATVCALSTPSGQAELRRKTGAPANVGCLELMTVVSAHIPPPIRRALTCVKVRKVTMVSSTRATVADDDLTSACGDLGQFSDPGGPPAVFVKQGGRWKVSARAG